MSYLEELLPEFRKGAKIRKRDWEKERYLYFECEDIWNEDNELVSFSGEDLVCDSWELYQEPIDWNYIIKKQCLCYFYDDGGEENKHIGILKELKKYETYKFSIITPDNYVNDISFTNCRPVRRDEVTFYEDRKDE